MNHRTRSSIGVVIALTMLFGGGCAYFNTLYNAKQKYREALDIKRKADPEREKITTQEETLYGDAFEKAASVVKYHPDSRWVDDALLLMAKASHEKGDYSTALRKYDEIFTFFPDSDVVPEARVMQGRSLIETRDYDKAKVALDLAAKRDKEEYRADVVYFQGVVEDRRGRPEEAVAAYGKVVQDYHDSRWLAHAGLRAGDIAREQGDLETAVAMYDQVRKHGHSPLEQYRGGMKKGEALLQLEEYDRARITFRDVADRTANEDDRGRAYLMEAKAVDASGDFPAAREKYLQLIDRYPRRDAAAEAQFAIGEHFDQEGDLETALTEYTEVKEQGTGFPAWQRASIRQAEIQRVLDLRAELAEGTSSEPERTRFLLAEQLLEKIGDVDAALAEYASLAEDTRDSEWGSRATYAQAWVLENRKDEPDSASALLFRLANRDTRSEYGHAARRRFNMPVWTVREIPPERIVFVGEGGDQPQDIAVSLVQPREVPLPPGQSEVEVWVRLTLDDDGSVSDEKVVKSGGEEFDAASREAAEQSRFLAPRDGGPAITVVRYFFPPRSGEGDADSAPSGDDEPSAAERDAMLNAQDANASAPPDASPPPGVDAAPGVEPASDTNLPPGTAPPDSVGPGEPPPPDPRQDDDSQDLPPLRDRRLDRDD